MNRSPALYKQRGITLLILAVIIVLSFATFAISQLSINDVKAKQLLKTQAALKEAKAALIAFSINYPEYLPTVRGPGYFPCPDVTGNGISTVNDCNDVGRLPWKLLNVGDIRDGDTERLWYAVAKDFGYSTLTAVNKINRDTTGSITLSNSKGDVLYDGTGDDALVAVIIAPGKALTRNDGVIQNRSADTNLAINYLDVLSGRDNASFTHNNIDDGFIQKEFKLNSVNLKFNDVIMVITRDDIMPLIQKRVVAQMKKAINDFRNDDNCGVFPASDAGRLPVDAPQWSEPGCAANLLPEWIKEEGWHDFYLYTQPASEVVLCDDNCISPL